MYLLFEEAGKFQAGRVLSEAESSAQVELDSGKRVKVKAANILLKFDKPTPAELMAQAAAVAQTIELELAWEFAPEDEFGFADLARDYFNDNATLAQQAGALFCLFEAPHYFRRAGKGRFRKAPSEIVQQALVAIEKKKALLQQIADWSAELCAGSCPAPVQEQLFKILFRPDKNAPEYKAVVEASRAAQLAPLALLQRAGAIASPYQFHWQRFLFDNFPKGTGIPTFAGAGNHRRAAAVTGASSVHRRFANHRNRRCAVGARLGSGTVVVGIHIAAPGLAVLPGSPIDQVGRNRMSTVYMPGCKITMLPDEVVQRYTLTEGRECPAVSLYVTFDEVTLEVRSSETRLERVFITANLRHDQLDDVVTAEWLKNPDFEHQNGINPASNGRLQLSFLYRLAQELKARREVVRGKPETFNRPDYSFKLLDATGDVPTGQETVQISTRQRGAPLDLIVSEAMILANSTWGSWMAELGVPGIYRSQASLLPGVKVRMGTKALPHAGIGVKSYAWSTSPLRRYADLVNQWQIIACARHGRTAALAAPFKPKDADLFSIISGFDAAYIAYNGYQAGMERFWTLKYLQQQGIAELTATTFKEGPGGSWLVRADELPLVFPVLGAQGLTRGARLRVKLGDIDEIALDVSGTVLERLDAAADASAGAGDDDGDGDDEAAAGPLTIAVDLDDAGATATPGPAGDNPPS